ncbi:MAG: TetR/AcrR family transcriptional regulator [Deltaproteobacteria bacterium]|nr:TetR/AcrR family transcriptional regulator [Deltaproteobacteria bacterium]
MKNPPQRSRQVRKENTQARILEVARRHFENGGFDKTSIRNISIEAEVAVGTVLLHFTDKLGLLHAALHDDLERTIEHCLAAPNRGALLTRMCGIARPFFAYYAKRPKLSRVLLRESLFAEPPWRERFGEQLARVQGRVVNIVEAARLKGEISPTTNPSLFAAAFSCFYYFTLAAWIQGRVDSPLPLFEKLMAQHLAGVTARSTREK